MALVLKVDAKGGGGGNEWDDRYEYDNITKIYVRGGREGILFIKFEYIKAGQITIGQIHGVSGSGFTQTFEIDNSENEFLLSVEGYYKESTGVIQCLEFITNKKTSGPIGYNEGTKFLLRGDRSKIIGFHGFADNYLKSLGAYVVRVPSRKSELKGGQGGRAFDDGGDYDGVQNLFVTTDGTLIKHIRFDYVKGSQVETRERGMKIGTTHEFVINHPYEYIKSVEGTHNTTPSYGSSVVLTSLTFKTSKGRASPTIGSVNGTGFKLESQGNAIVGFHGRVGGCIDSIGVYYSPFPPSPPPPPPEKLQVQGGDCDDSWVDVAFENVKNIHRTR